MRTETRTYEVYTLNELTKKAREKAYNNWLERHDYYWDGEYNQKTLQAFEQTFNIKMERWSYDTYNYTYRFTSNYSEEEDNLKGIRLLKFLVNNYWNDLYRPRDYWKSYQKKRESHIFVSNNSVLIGYYMDDVILKPIYDFLKSPDDTTLYELMDKCLDGFFKACRDDMEYQFSEEYFAESCEENNYEFLSDGTMF